MEITEIRVKLVGGPTERVKAFCTITLDGGFVVRDLKVIEGPNGLFLAMPSRKLADRCPKCAAKNHLRARFCNHCGVRLNDSRAPRDDMGRIKLHADVAHPINAECRELIQTAVVAAFHVEVEKSGMPGYEPAQDVDDEFAGVEYDEFMEASRETRGLTFVEPPPREAPRDRAPADRSTPPRLQPVGHASPAPTAGVNPLRGADVRPPLKAPPKPEPKSPARRPVAPAVDEPDDGGFAAGIV